MAQAFIHTQRGIGVLRDPNNLLISFKDQFHFFGPSGVCDMLIREFGGEAGTIVGSGTWYWKGRPANEEAVLSAIQSM